jgi:hypothetical protein
MWPAIFTASWASIHHVPTGHVLKRNANAATFVPRRRFTLPTCRTFLQRRRRANLPSGLNERLPFQYAR